MTITTPPSPSSGEPLAIGATVTNVGDFPILNLNLTLDIPVFYNSSDLFTFDVALLGEGEQVEFNWDLTPLRPDISSVGYFSINITSDNGGSQDEPIDVLLQLPPTTGNTSPIARAGGPYSANEGEPVTLDASGSSDPDGTIVLYEWDLDNDGFVDAKGVTVSVTFDNDGTFSIALRVTDDQGATDTDSADVTVSNVAPKSVAPPTPSSSDDDDDDDDSGGGGEVGGGGEPVTPTGPTPLETTFGTLSSQRGGRLSTGITDTVEASVEMPPGAVDQNTGIRIESISASDLALPTLPPNTFSRVFRFSPEALQFLLPITLIISYVESEVDGLDENTIVPILLVGNDWVTLKDCESGDPLLADPCLANRDIVNNELTIKTTHFSIYGVKGAVALPPPPMITPTEVASALELLQSNLVRVWHFDNTTKEWTFYDPRPVFAASNTLKELVPGEAYTIRVINDQTATLNRKVQRLYAGWNLIGW